MRHSAMQHSTVCYSISVHRVVRFGKVQHGAVLYSAVQWYNGILHRTDHEYLACSDHNKRRISDVIRSSNCLSCQILVYFNLITQSAAIIPPPSGPLKFDMIHM